MNIIYICYKKATGVSDDVLISMAKNTEKKESSKSKLHRCLEWLQIQNNPDKNSLEDEDDKTFNIDIKSNDKNFKLEVDDTATVPAGVDEPTVEPKAVVI